MGRWLGHPGAPEFRAGSTWWAPTSWDAQPQGGLFWGGPWQAGSGRIGLGWAPGRHGMEAGGALRVQARPCSPERRPPGSLPPAQQGTAPASVHVWTPRWRLRCPHPRGVEASVRPSHSTAGGGRAPGRRWQLSERTHVRLHRCAHTRVSGGLTERGCAAAARGRGLALPAFRRPGGRGSRGRQGGLSHRPPARRPVLPSTQTDSVPRAPRPT